MGAGFRGKERVRWPHPLMTRSSDGSVSGSGDGVTQHLWLIMETAWVDVMEVAKYNTSPTRICIMVHKTYTSTELIALKLQKKIRCEWETDHANNAPERQSTLKVLFEVLCLLWPGVVCSFVYIQKWKWRESFETRKHLQSSSHWYKKHMLLYKERAHCRSSSSVHIN